MAFTGWYLLEMDRGDSTCWTLVLGAAAGNPDDRESFARRYGSVVRSYLTARWRLASRHEDVQDGTQEVFLECFKSGGPLAHADPTRPGGFRAFLFGIVRNVAARLEARRRSHSGRQEEQDLEGLASDTASLSRVFDRAWAQMIAAEALDLMAARASKSDAATLRLKMLEMRYGDGLASREIAATLDQDTFRVYRLLNEARMEYRAAILEVMAGYHPADQKHVLEERCAALLDDLET